MIQPGMLEAFQSFQSPSLILDQHFVDEILSILTDVLKCFILKVVVMRTVKRSDS